MLDAVNQSATPAWTKPNSMVDNKLRRISKGIRLVSVIVAGCCLLPLGACDFAGQVGGQAPRDTTAPQLPAVDVAIAKPETSPSASVEYTGTTAPMQAVAVRARIEGKLLDLAVNVGDAVRAGQVIAQLDDTTPATALLQSEAEVSARQAEVAQAYANISVASARLSEAQLQLQQAEAESRRLQLLAKEGAVPTKSAEDAQIAVRSAEQSLRALQAQVSAQRQAVQSAEERVRSQQALVLQAQERFSYTTVTAPIDGLVLERVTEPGNLLFAGNEIIRLGDLSQIKVMVMVSELEISQVRSASPVQVRFDAIPNRSFTGRVSRISPSADPVSRQIPVEITIDNSDRLIGSGQLARVRLAGKQQEQIISIPTSALTGRRQRDEAKSEGRQERTATLFVVVKEGGNTIVRSRKVQIGDRRDGKVVILSGLEAGERYVARSGGRLKEGDQVRVSVLSE